MSVGEHGARGVLLEERDRPAQDGLVEVVAKIGDHAEAGVVHEIGAAVVAEALDDRGDDEGKGDGSPVVMKVCGDKLPQIELVMGSWNFEEGDSAISGMRVENVIEDRLDKQQPEGFKQPDGGHENDGEQRLQRIGPEIAEETKVFCHPRSPLVAAAREPGSGADAAFTAISLLYPPPD